MKHETDWNAVFVSLCYSLKYVMHHSWRLEFTSLNVICNVQSDSLFSFFCQPTMLSQQLIILVWSFVLSCSFATCNHLFIMVSATETLVSLTDKQLILEEDRDGCYMHRMESEVIPDLLQDEIVSEQLTRYTVVRTLTYCFTLLVISWIVICCELLCGNPT